MKIIIINKSDSTGGAAVVSRRLMEALRAEGQDAHMIVAEKLSNSPYIHLAGSSSRIKSKFLFERLKVFLANGFNRKTLFKIDTGEIGLPLWRHPLVKEADAILLNWFNHGMLSLKGVRKILELNKPVVWTMHDMWPMTGICHHAGDCRHFLGTCGDCPLLEKKRGAGDLSFKIHKRKEELYNLPHKITFVAVSTWLQGKARMSSLLCRQRVEFIPNAFHPEGLKMGNQDDARELNRCGHEEGKRRKIWILFGAARLDDPIKGLDTFREACDVIRAIDPKITSNVEIAFFGSVKNPDSLNGFAFPVIKLGTIKGEEKVAETYMKSQIVVSASSYETLPGTLVEAQAYGCIPVSFNQGGQEDIVENLKTGIIVPYSNDKNQRALNLAEGILKAVSIIEDGNHYEEMRKAMRESVINKFSYQKIATQYLELIKSLQSGNLT